MKVSDLMKVLGFYGRFTPSYSRIGYLARRIGWGSHRPDFHGQRWLVTGASGGIGAAIVRAGVNHGATVVAVARNPDKLDTLRTSLDPAVRDRMEPCICDLASVQDIDRMIASLDSSQPIDVVMNNVGILLNEHSLTAEGCETTYVTNLLGHFQLVETLLEKQLLGPNPVVVNMASGGLYNLPLGLGLLNITDAKRHTGKGTYAAHKRAQTALSAYWDRRLRELGGRSYVMHPGWARTEGVRGSLPVFYKIQGAILRSPAEGADTAVWLADQRPEEGGIAIWFDRAVRPQHMFEHTKDPQCSEQDLVDYLSNDLHRLRKTPPATAEAV